MINMMIRKKKENGVHKGSMVEKRKGAEEGGKVGSCCIPL